MLSVLAAGQFVFVVGILTMPLWFRAVNQITAPLFGRVLVICPHCGLPGVAHTTDPAVFQTAVIGVKFDSEVGE